MTSGITAVILLYMKTAISMQDKLFRRVDRYAKREKISRSQLFSAAAEEYLNKREAEEITENLNSVYSSEDSSIDPVLFKMASLSIPKEKW